MRLVKPRATQDAIAKAEERFDGFWLAGDGDEWLEADAAGSKRNRRFFEKRGFDQGRWYDDRDGDEAGAKK